MEDKTIKCRDCGQEFVFSVSEQEFYKEKGFTNEPVRCKECRNKKKAERFGSGRNNNNRSGRPSNNSWRNAA